MIILGITGGSGTGKTTISELFKKEGVDVIDADKVAKKIQEPGTPCLFEIEKTFGREYINNDKTLNRKLLASLVFSDSKKLQILNKITHKYITEYINNYIHNSKAQICAIDAPVLFESGLDKKCNFIISVLSDCDTRIERITKRDKISVTDAEKRINAQRNDDFYIENSDYIVYNKNNNILENLSDEVKKILNDIRSRI